MKHSVLRISVLSLAMSLIQVGCSTGGGTRIESKADFAENYRNGNFTVAAQQASEKARLNEQGVGKNLLWSLKAADAWRVAGNVDKSTTIFEGTEDTFRRFDTENAAKKYIVDNASSILVNDKAVAYKGTFYDATMVNTYKAINYVNQGDWDNARIELNRVLERQDHAKKYFEAMIEKERKKEHEAKTPSHNDDSTVKINTKKTNVEIEKLKRTAHNEMDEWEISPNYINPFTTYLSGLLLYLNADTGSDVGEARRRLRKARALIEMDEKTTSLAKSYLDEDLKIVDNGSLAKDLEPTVWVVFENGQAPIKEEKRVDLPLFLVTDAVLYAGIAYPTLKFRESAYPFIEVSTGDKTYRTATIANMDGLISKEFKTEFPGIMTRAIVSATVKTIAQQQVKEKYGGVAGFGAALLQAVSTQADLRIWSTLPKEFQIARLPRPDTGVLTIQLPETNQTMTVTLPGDKHNIVYLKIPTRSSVPVLTAMATGDRNGQTRVAVTDAGMAVGTPTK